MMNNSSRRHSHMQSKIALIVFAVGLLSARLQSSNVVAFHHNHHQRHDATALPKLTTAAGTSIERSCASSFTCNYVSPSYLRVSVSVQSQAQPGGETLKNRGIRVRVRETIQRVQRRCLSILPLKDNNVMKRGKSIPSEQMKSSVMNSTSLQKLGTQEHEVVAPAIEGYGQPKGPRWAVPANATDLSGKWKVVLTPEFKDKYDQYLQNITSPAWFRKVMLPTLGLLEDHIHQDGTKFTMSTKNPAGSWTRTLVSSGACTRSSTYEPLEVTIVDPDKDKVQVESWWEKGGTVHRSILRNKPKVKGGIFETLRYLDDHDTLITESIFHPPNSPSYHRLETSLSGAMATNGNDAITTATVIRNGTAGSKNQYLKPAYIKWKHQRIQQ